MYSSDEDEDSSSIIPFMYKCTYYECTKQFAKKSKLNRHYNTHLNDRPFVCQVKECFLTYTRKEHLKRHLKSHASTIELQKPFSCIQCPARFDTAYHLKRHSKSHTSYTLFPCLHCNESFNKHYKLQEHMQQHATDPTLYTCKECQKQYNSLAQLHRHEKMHLVQRTYVCGFVGCTHTSTKWTLLQAHTKSTHPPTCQVCNKQFTRQDGLKGHQKSTGHSFQGTDIERKEPKKLFHCMQENCSKVYQSVKSMIAHSKTSHEGKAFECEICGKVLRHQQTLDRHSLLHFNGNGIRENDEIDKLLEIQKDFDAAEIDEECGTDAEDESINKGRTLIDILTGHDYAMDEERDIDCPMDGCAHRFYRLYDCHRHVNSQHPTGTFVDPVLKLMPVF